MKEKLKLQRFVWLALMISVLAVFVARMPMGCSTEREFRNVQAGMTEREVREIMGEPQSKSGHPGEGRSYDWTWQVWFEPMHVLVVRFSTNGTVEEVSEQ